MKVFTLLATVISVEALASKDSCSESFYHFDKNGDGTLSSGGVYAALEDIDTKNTLTEDQLHQLSNSHQPVNFQQFLDICEKALSEPTLSSPPKGCKNWFDGCNHCILKNGEELGCTEMVCHTQKHAFCTVFEDGRQCKSANDCTMPTTASWQTQYNCYTREVWTPQKKEYCCKVKNIGCPVEKTTRQPQTQYNCYTREVWTSQKKEYCCTVRNIGCTIPTNCVRWYDGCNTCSVQNGRIGGCTKMACFRQATPRCVEFQHADGGLIVVHDRNLRVQ